MMDTSWHGYRAEPFTFEGRDAIVVFPEKPLSGSPWLLKTEYWDAFPDIELRLLEKGFHVAFVSNRNRWATQEECRVKARFVEYVSVHYGLDRKCIPVGMSCGGAYAVKFGGMFPHLVRGLYADAPVLNFCSIPGKTGVAFNETIWDREFTVAYPGIRRHQLPGWGEHPICFVENLIKERVPVLLVYGKEDSTVLYEENGRLLKDAYEGTGLLKCIAVPARGHHPHGMIGDNSVIVDHITQWAPKEDILP